MAPVSVDTTGFDTPTGFQSESDGRGTVRIIWMFLTTIFLASWTSYHENPEYPGHHCLRVRFHVLKEKFKYAFLLPEVGAVGSLKDFFEAFKLSGYMMIYRKEFPGWQDFSMNQAFLCVKGGIYQKTPESDQLVRVDRNRLMWLANTRQLNYSEYPSKDEISDKSKADWTLKTISIVQTFWFVLNIVVRLKHDYPVSLLECLASAHVFCGMIAFFSWFSCPQSIQQPFVIKPATLGRRNNNTEETAKDRETAPLSWFQWVKNSLSPLSPPDVDDTADLETPATEKPTPVEELGKSETASIPQTEDESRTGIRSRILPPWCKSVRRYILYRLCMLYLCGYQKWRGRYDGKTADEWVPKVERGLPFEEPLSQSSSQNATKATTKVTATERSVQAGDSTSNEISPGSQAKEGPQRRDRPNVEWGVRMTIFVIFAAIHCAAWQYPFPSDLEKWGWRGCALGMIACGVRLTKDSYKCNQDRKRLISWAFPRATMWLYVICRIAMLGIALAAFRRAPEGIYEVPEWTEYWPHI